MAFLKLKILLSWLSVMKDKEMLVVFQVHEQVLLEPLNYIYEVEINKINAQLH